MVTQQQMESLSNLVRRIDDLDRSGPAQCDPLRKLVEELALHVKQLQLEAYSLQESIQDVRRHVRHRG